MIKSLKQKNKKNACPAKLQRSRGFTLVETLVAISIFSMSIVALMSVLGSGISNTNYAKTKIIASYLAQEGIEYIRNMRDTYVLYTNINPSLTWNSFKSTLEPTPLSPTLCMKANGCFFNADSFPTITFTACSSATCSNGPLFYDYSTGKYNNSSLDKNSGFTRIIKMNTTGLGPNEVKISSTVSWTQGSGNYNITFSENLFNWTQ